MAALTEAQEQLGQLIDKLDHIASATLIQRPAEFHIGILRELLPALVVEFRASFVAVTGEDPWDGA